MMGILAIIWFYLALTCVVTKNYLVVTRIVIYVTSCLRLKKNRV